MLDWLRKREPTHCRSSGFYILRTYLGVEDNILEIDIDNEDYSRHKEGPTRSSGRRSLNVSRNVPSSFQRFNALPCYQNMRNSIRNIGTNKDWNNIPLVPQI